MSDLKNPKLIYLKGFLFLFTGLISAILLLMLAGSWQIAILLLVCIWSFSRFYFFAFYVIEHYIDSKYRFAGLLDFILYIFRGPANRS